MHHTIILIVGLFLGFASTIIGSAVVYLFRKDLSLKTNSLILGFAGGVMIAASVFGLIMPALQLGEATWGRWNALPVVVGILLGGLLLVAIDKIVPHIHKSNMVEEGPKNRLTKPFKLFLAVTIHNIPEGLAVGFAFGLAMVSGETAAYISALALSIGIAIQNFPEGAAISLPMRRETGSKHKAFLYGSASGAVEPIFAAVGILLATSLSVLMPWFLAFAAGAMLFVTIEDLIPDAKLSATSHLGTWGFMVGFIIMMLLDILLG